MVITVTRARFIESKTLISNQENIEIYYINLDVFSIGNQYFAFNEPDSVSPSNFSVFEVCFLGSHKLVLLPNVVFSLPLWLLLLPEPGSLKAKH